MKYLIALFGLVVMVGVASAGNNVAEQNTSPNFTSIVIPPVTVANLPACTIGRDGALANVSNNVAACSFGNAVTNGGSNKCMVKCDGNSATWLVASGGAGTAVNTLAGFMGGLWGFSGVSAQSTGYPILGLNAPVAWAGSANLRGRGVWNGTAGDGSWTSTDSSCGTAGRCFSSASGAFTAGDVGKTLTVAGINGTIPAGTFSRGTYPFTTTVASVQSGTLLTMAATPAGTSQTGEPWWLGTDNTSSLQTRVSGAGDTQIPAGLYLINGQINVPSFKNIQCQDGAVLVNVHLGRGGSAAFGANTFQWKLTNHGSLSNCTLEGTDLPGINGLTSPGYDETNEWDFAVLATGGAGTTNDIIISGNTFRYFWGNSTVQAYAPDATNITDHLEVVNNIFSDCGIYACLDDASNDFLCKFNSITDCSVGVENDNISPQGTILRGEIAYNVMNQVHGQGARAGTPLLTGGAAITGANYGGVTVFNNTCQNGVFIQNTGPRTSGAVYQNNSGCAIN